MFYQLLFKKKKILEHTDDAILHLITHLFYGMLNTLFQCNRDYKYKLKKTLKIIKLWLSFFLSYFLP